MTRAAQKSLQRKALTVAWTCTAADCPKSKN